MKLYADAPGRRSRQVFADLLFVAWLVLWVYVAGVVNDSTLQLAEPGYTAERAAQNLSGGLASTRDTLADTPLVGGQIASGMDQAIEASDQLAEAGRQEVAAVETLAFWLYVCIGTIPTLIVAAFYLPGRVRFARRATAGKRFVDANQDLDLFALRALSNQPMHVLERISSDPAGAWRARDPEVVARLAELEMRSVGLSPHRRS
jgi:hypothetical protein